MRQGLLTRMDKLERHRGGRRWYVAERGAEWRGDVAAALGLSVAPEDLLVVIKRYGRPDARPRLVTEYTV
jgi:hypothetical protein